LTDQDYFKLAVATAHQGLDTWTNPQVGAVIVKDGQVIATGYHHQFGQAHAEVDALSQLDDVADAKGATVYVTLEPCSHYGKTPPCAKRLAEVGVARVVIGQQDPNPLVSGKGIQLLEDHGVAVTVLNQIADLNEAYSYFYQHHQPYFTLKYAMSLDGKINGAGTARTQLTSGPAQQDVQQLRSRQHAILIGEHTLLNDDPQLTVRTRQQAFPPIRIALVRDVNQLDRRLKLFNNAAPTWFLSEADVTTPVPENVKVVVRPEWTPAVISQYLTEQGLQAVLVEGGSQVQAAFLAADLVNELVVYVAPKVLGGAGLPAAVGEPLTAAFNLGAPTITQFGHDVRVRARRV
jgi:diaminohydroxyphosphoribosylaminopyrimidine deaminase/5-amino-6-(5-phosphoribosylamino)uracil reductase